MYVPPVFREDRIEALHDLMRRHSFAMLVSVLDGELFSTHVPLILEADRGTYGTLVGHLAKANPHWRAFERPESDAAFGTGSAGSAGAATALGTVLSAEDLPETLVIFSGPHAYISPSWYETPVAVPTWNYVAVHAYGRPRVIADPHRVKRLLNDLVDTYESAFPTPWTMDGLPDTYVDKMVENIVAFEIPITRLEGKRKLSQNRSAAARQGTIAALRASGSPEEAAVADLMAARA